MANFPFRFISDLPKRAQHELWRNFEYLGTTLKTTLPFVVVASDGTGQYTSIKAAIDAVETSPDIPHMIWVKPRADATAYDDGIGTIDVSGKHVVIFGPSFRSDSSDFTRQEWKFGGFTSTSGGGNVQVIGMELVISLGGGGLIDGSSASYYFLDCFISSSAGATAVVKSGAASQAHFYDCTFSSGMPLYPGAVTALAAMKFVQCRGITTMTASNIVTAGNLEFHESQIVNLKGEIRGSGIFVMTNCDVSATSDSFIVAGTKPLIQITSSRLFQDGSTTIKSITVTIGGNRANPLVIADNLMPNVALTVKGGSVATSHGLVTGTYNRLAIDNFHRLAATVALNLVTQASKTALDFIGDSDDCVIVASFENGSGASNTGIAFSAFAENNTVIATNLDDFATQVSDSGSGNKVNTFTPAAHTHPSTDITDFAEAVDDRVDQLLVEGTNITLTYDDGANTLTIAAAGAADAQNVQDFTHDLLLMGG